MNEIIWHLLQEVNAQGTIQINLLPIDRVINEITQKAPATAKSTTVEGTKSAALPIKPSELLKLIQEIKLQVRDGKAYLEFKLGKTLEPL